MNDFIKRNKEFSYKIANGVIITIFATFVALIVVILTSILNKMYTVDPLDTSGSLSVYINAFIAAATFLYVTYTYRAIQQSEHSIKQTSVIQQMGNIEKKLENMYYPLKHVLNNDFKINYDSNSTYITLESTDILKIKANLAKINKFSHLASDDLNLKLEDFLSYFEPNSAILKRRHHQMLTSQISRETDDRMIGNLMFSRTILLIPEDEQYLMHHIVQNKEKISKLYDEIVDKVNEDITYYKRSLAELNKKL
ncbi:hypothetical protein [Methanococcoides alaskense]|uniref:Uncharacterized protein n=1 Tax=Methanococcoides alaskense TaxID=325778 RepID=A0AA90U1M2_9EURY|nr:hypothetical protein [Methanococcoides alaskense]MDA0524214.1 hypothetical protein [Methanococcoides alaskense]MDR6223663.1 hypothetical protein [Methanococcoides alaskense]